MKTSQNKKSVVGIAVLVASLSLVTVKPFNIDLWSAFAGKRPQEDKPVLLTPGKQLPRESTVKIPAVGLSPADTVGIAVVDTEYGKPFWFPGVVRDGYVYCHVSLGNEWDKGRIFKLQGLSVDPTQAIKPRTPLDSLPAGKIFYGPSTHVRG